MYPITHKVKLIEWELFFDQDPGYGNGTQIPVIVQNSVIKVTTNLNCSNISTGLHHIYFRVKDNLGN